MPKKNSISKISRKNGIINQKLIYPFFSFWSFYIQLKMKCDRNEKNQFYICRLSQKYKNI